MVEETRELQKTQQDELARLEVAHEQKMGYLQDLQNDQQALESQLYAWDRKSSALADQIAAIQRARRDRGESLNFGGMMMKPAQGPYTSQFGPRFHPILKRNRPHNGIDIGARNRSPIVAAADGEVINAEWMSGYGYTVVIDHGDSISTLYAHCSTIYAKAGDMVLAGQRIALVGSTGMSTGPHLHFEVRLNGRPVDPRNYLP